MATKNERRARGIMAILGGFALLVIAVIIGPVEDIFTAGVGLIDDPIAAAAGIGGIGLIIWGINQLVGR